MKPDDAFLQSLRSDFQDKSLWLVYADYLEEQGDPRSAFIHQVPLLPVPWKWLVVGEGLVQELQRELAPNHRLHGKQVTSLAQRNGCEDVLYLVDGVSLAVVHLTWNDSRESDPRRPATTMYLNWEEWMNRCMNSGQKAEVG